MPILVSQLMKQNPTETVTSGDIELWENMKKYFNDTHTSITKATQVPTVINDAYYRITGETLVGNPKELTGEPYSPANVTLEFWLQKAPKILIQRYYLATFS